MVQPKEDSTNPSALTCSLNSLDIELVVFLVTSRPRHMNVDSPISRHREFHDRLVTARLNLVCVGKHGNHARMRHFSFQRDLSTGDWFACQISDSEGERHRPDARRLRRDPFGELEFLKPMAPPRTIVRKHEADTERYQ